MEIGVAGGERERGRAIEREEEGEKEENARENKSKPKKGEASEPIQKSRKQSGACRWGLNGCHNESKKCVGSSIDT